jgi:hypothetical protein
MTDFLLVAWVSALIELRRFGWIFGLGERWSPGEKLKLLFAGYNGTRNTGSDVRVQEMLRQIRHVLGPQSPRESRRSFLRRLDVQKQICQCAHHDDDRFAGASFGGEQIVRSLWR